MEPAASNKADKDKVVFTYDRSPVSPDSYVYHIQFVGANGVPRYLGRVKSDYLQTAVWFYRQEPALEVEFRDLDDR